MTSQKRAGNFGEAKFIWDTEYLLYCKEVLNKSIIIIIIIIIIFSQSQINTFLLKPRLHIWITSCIGKGKTQGTVDGCSMKKLNH